SARDDAETSTCGAFAFSSSGAGAGRETRAGGDGQGNGRRHRLGDRTRRAAAAGAIMAGVAGVPPLYRQFQASARQPRWRRCPLPALEAPPALAAADANTHTRTVNVNSEKVRKNARIPQTRRRNSAAQARYREYRYREYR